MHLGHQSPFTGQEENDCSFCLTSLSLQWINRGGNEMEALQKQSLCRPFYYHHTIIYSTANLTQGTSWTSFQQWSWHPSARLMSPSLMFVQAHPSHTCGYKLRDCTWRSSTYKAHRSHVVHLPIP